MRIKGKRFFLLVLAIVLCASSIAGAVLTVPVFALTLSAGGLQSTIASIVISLMLQAGVAPVNNTWVNTLNNAYGVESSIGTIENCITNGLLTETSNGLMDSGLSSAISSASAYTELGLDEIFITTAEDAGVIAASGAVNLTNTAINVGTLGTIGVFAGATALGVGIGVLANNIREKFVDYIKYGAPINVNEYALNKASQISAKNVWYFSRTTTGGAEYGNIKMPTVNNVAGYWFDGTRYYFRISNVSSGTGQYGYITTKNNQITSESYNEVLNVQTEGSVTTNGNTLSGTNYKQFASSNDFNDYVLGIKNGTIIMPSIVSPDLIGTEGNLLYDDNDDSINMNPTIPNGYDMNPINMNDYGSYVDQANSNTDNNDTGANQGEDLVDFISPYLVNPNDQPIIPDNPSAVPVLPDRPLDPAQPDLPSKPELSENDIDQVLEGVTTIDLRSVFPFCIPWDIYSLILLFDSGNEREAPYIHFVFPMNENWVIDIDLSEYDSVASILRLLELILFIIGLMVATRSLIGAKG